MLALVNPAFPPKTRPDNEDVDYPFFNKPVLQQEDEGESFPWNPSGYWPDPYEGRFRKDFRPHEFVGALMATPAAKRYGDVESLARSKGIQSVRGGEQAQIDETEQTAASQGLGRGYANQAKQNIRQQGSMAATEVVMGAALESRSRQYQQAALLAASLTEANKARFTAYLNKKAQESSESSSIIGGILGAVGDIAGAAIPFL
jgi:hypothetical protein